MRPLQDDKISLGVVPLTEDGGSAPHLASAAAGCGATNRSPRKGERVAMRGIVPP